MPKVTGYVLLFVSSLVTIVELYFVIIEPLVNGVNLRSTPSQYWSIAIPIFLIVLIIGITTMWIGYTMITTPEPMKFTYEEAYENAILEVDEEKEDSQ